MAKATQEFIPIKEIRNGIAVMRDGSLRGIVMASSLNFALKSNDEQIAILSQFQNFLNSLDFPVQIFIESRELDIRPYLALLETRFTQEMEELIKTQTREYIEFIKAFTRDTNIMTKSFFIIIPYSPEIISSSSQNIKGIFKKKTAEEVQSARIEAFEENRSQLEQRIAVVEQGLSRTGIRIARLGTEEIVELFYRLFNPGDAEKPMSVHT